MAARYVDNYPSQAPSLDDYGAHLAQFCSAFTPLQDLPYIADLAKLEWAWHRAFHAADEKGVALEALNRFSPEQQTNIQFKLKKSLSCFQFNYPISEIWTMNRDLTPLKTIDISSGGERVIIWRNEYQVHVDVLTELEDTFLKGIKKGQTLGTIYESLLSKYGSKQLTRAWPRILSSGWLADFSFHASNR